MMTNKIEYWMVIAKETTMGDVEVWHGDYEDCMEFYCANDGVLNGARLDVVVDEFMESITKPRLYGFDHIYDDYDDGDLEELPFE